MGNLILNSKGDNFNFEELVNFIKKYYKLLNHYPIIINTQNDSYADTIKKVKRDNSMQIGPYVNITMFEAINRIASDLVILNGLYQLIAIDELEPEDSKMKICLGNENHLIGDFIINGKNGEAFNVAKSFFSGKLSQTKNKWGKKNEQLHYLLYNGDLGKKIIKSENGFCPIPIAVIDWEGKQFL